MSEEKITAVANVRCEVFIPAIDCFELAAINSDDRLAKQVELAAEGHKPLAHVSDAFAVIMTKFGDGLEVRG